MIRLLELQDDGEFRLREFEDEDTVPMYATLSHTWSTNKNDELSYEDLRVGRGREKSGRQKLQFCQKQVVKDGMWFCWIDTCCINKDNAREESYAINSMFRWYRNAAKCYVYLSDVVVENPHMGDQLSTTWETAFRRSKWFTRGWTLQELLAPAKVEFFSAEGLRLGNKSSLEQIIHKITAIPVLALHGRPLSDFTVDERKSWANSRRTREPEDGAYCLTGIFNVTVIPNYGEGAPIAFNRLDEAIQSSLTRIQHNLQPASSLSHHYSNGYPPAKRRRLDTESSVDSDQQKTILESLKFDQIETRRLNIKNAHARTCRWLLTDSQYIEWLDNERQRNHHGFLWIKGKAGSGKSTLMKFILDNSRKKMKENILLSFFFNARGSDLERSVVGAYRTILVQLLEQVPSLQSIFNILGPLASKISLDHFWDTELLETLLIEAFQSLEGSSVMCFIDALDECDEEEIRDMISFFENICEKAAPNDGQLRICFASRYYPHITAQNGLSLEMDGKEGHKLDIANYLASQLKIGHSNRADEIKIKLSEMASGVFMWVVLVVGILNKEYDKGRMNALEQRLAEIPPDIYRLFHDILTRDSRNKGDLALCIQWVLFTKQPLTAKQLHLAIRSGNEDATLSMSEHKEIMRENSDLFILDVSKGLVETTRSKNPTIQFIHESVKDFLLKENGLGKIWPSLANNPEGKCHEQLKQSCLSYTSADFSGYVDFGQDYQHVGPEEVAQLRESISKSFPLIEYTVSNILYHADKAAQNGISQITFLKIFRRKDWVALVNIFEKFRNRRYGPNVSLLYIMAGKNTPSLIESYHSAPSYLHVEMERYGTPLFAALAVGNAAAARVFLRSHAVQRPNCQDFERWLENAPDEDLVGRFHRRFKFSPGKVPLLYFVEFAHDRLLEFVLGAFISVNNDDWFEVKDITRCLYKHRRLQPILRHLDAVMDVNLELELFCIAIVMAAEKGNEQIVRMILDKGVDVNINNVTSCTALHMASCTGHEQIVRLLLSRDANVQALDNHNQSALCLASKAGQEKTVRILLDNGANVHASDEDGRTALHLASVHGYEQVVKMLLDNGANVHASAERGWTALHLASIYRYEQVVKMLLDNGANVHASDEGGQTTLHLASANGHQQVVKMLLDNGANVQASDEGGQTALHEASANGYMQIVKILLDNGADVHASDEEGRTTLHSTSISGREQVVKMLLDNGADVHASDKDRRTALHLASTNGHQQVVKMLLDNGADVHASDEGGQTTLHLASANGHQQVVKMLLDNGANVHASAERGWTALHLASIYRYEQVVKMLLDNGANVHASDEGGQTTLHLASFNGHEQVVKILLDNGADVHASDEEGRTALHLASILGHEQVVKMLLDNGANVHASDEGGQTTLHLASVNRHEQVVKILLDSGADVHASDEEGRTALHLAFVNGHKQVVKILMDNGANVQARDGH